MTKEQADKLCRVDPEHFYVAEGVVFNDGKGFCSSLKERYTRGYACWWMMTQMPGGSWLHHATSADHFGYQWIARATTDDRSVATGRGFGPTREEAVTNAYISWVSASRAQSEVTEQKGER
jgi:hypothetical protein